MMEVSFTTVNESPDVNISEVGRSMYPGQWIKLNFKYPTFSTTVFFCGRCNYQSLTQLSVEEHNLEH